MKEKKQSKNGESGGKKIEKVSNNSAMRTKSSKSGGKPTFLTCNLV